MRRLITTVFALAAVSVLGGAVGLLVGGGGRPHGSLVTRSTTTLRVPGGPPVTTTATGTVATQPLVTLSTPTVTTPQDRLPGYGRPTVQLADMNTPEQFVLGELYMSALRQQGFSVSLSRNVGETAISQLALKQRTLDIYPQYLNVWNRVVAHSNRRFASSRAAFAFASAYARRHGFELLPATPGADTPGFAVTSQFASENGVHTLADLAHQPLLNFGIPIGFGGLWRAEQAYGFKPATVRRVDTGSQYGALLAGSIQVAYVNSTDPALATTGFTLLRDPLHVYGFGNIVPVTTPAVIRAEGPVFVRTIERVDALLTTRALRGLNDEVILKGHDPAIVAINFLQGNGLMPAPIYVPAHSGS